jgi:Pyruvate/2-oxoacid:ferredoxin oxidoreductase gamma subunit
VDALSIAEEVGLGATINTAILGAYAKASGAVPMDVLEKTIRDTVPAKIEANVAAAKRAYEITRLIS